MRDLCIVLGRKRTQRVSRGRSRKLFTQDRAEKNSNRNNSRHELKTNHFVSGNYRVPINLIWIVTVRKVISYNMFRIISSLKYVSRAFRDVTRIGRRRFHRRGKMVSMDTDGYIIPDINYRWYK